MPEARSLHTSVVAGGMLMIFGGDGNGKIMMLDLKGLN